MNYRRVRMDWCDAQPAYTARLSDEVVAQACGPTSGREEGGNAFSSSPSSPRSTDWKYPVQAPPRAARDRDLGAALGAQQAGWTPPPVRRRGAPRESARCASEVTEGDERLTLASCP